MFSEDLHIIDVNGAENRKPSSTLSCSVPASPLGYVPATAPFIVGNVRVTEKFFAFAAVGVVSTMPCCALVRRDLV